MYNKARNYFEGNIMMELSIFENLTIDEINILLKISGARRIKINKDSLIFSKLDNDGFIGIILSGIANVIKYDINGNKIVIDNLEYGSILGKPFSNFDKDASIISSSDCEVLFLDYKDLINSEYYETISNNIISILSNNISKLNERIEILSKRTIRDKLLGYFELMSKKKNRKSFSIPITFIELANYLSIDRSAMMREIKKLKEEKIISTNKNKITLLK